jgi:hypothetical protein
MAMTCAPVCCFTSTRRLPCDRRDVTRENELMLQDEPEFRNRVADHGVVSLVVGVEEDEPWNVVTKKLASDFPFPT